MLVEHSYVTTVPAEKILTETAEALQSLGYRVPVRSQDTRLEAERGLAKCHKAKRFSDLPQRVSVEYDRGRVMLVAQVEIYRKRHKLHEQMLLALARMVESVAGDEEARQAARRQWEEVNAAIETLARSRCLRSWIVAAILVSLIGALIALAIVA